MPHWRAIHVQPYHEAAAERALERHAIQTFLPRLMVRRHRRGSPIPTLRPWFPGYLFANLSGQPYGLVRRCNWVIGIIGTVPIPVTVMAAIQNASQSISEAQGRPSWIPGGIYRLRRSFGDFLVKFERLDERERAVVMLTMFGEERIITVQPDDLQEQ